MLRHSFQDALMAQGLCGNWGGGLWSFVPDVENTTV